MNETHTATLYGEVTDVPVKRDGNYWVSRYAVRMALWHRPQDVAEIWPIDDAAKDDGPAA